MIVPVIGCKRMVNLFCDHPVEGKCLVEWVSSSFFKWSVIHFLPTSKRLRCYSNGVLLQMSSSNNRFQNVVQTSLHMMGQYIPKILNNGGTVLDKPHFMMVIQFSLCSGQHKSGTKAHKCKRKRNITLW